MGERARKEVVCETRAGNKLQHFLDGDALVQPHVIGLHARSHRAKSLEDIAGGGLAAETDLHGITAHNLCGSDTGKGRGDFSSPSPTKTTLALAHHHMVHVVMVISSLAQQPGRSSPPVLPCPGARRAGATAGLAAVSEPALTSLLHFSLLCTVDFAAFGSV